jgi:hypothetical protein
MVLFVRFLGEQLVLDASPGTVRSIRGPQAMAVLCQVHDIYQKARPLYVGLGVQTG